MPDTSTCPRCFGKDGAHYLGCVVGRLFERILGDGYPWQAREGVLAHRAEVATMDLEDMTRMYRIAQDEVNRLRERNKLLAEDDAETQRLRRELDLARSERDQALSFIRLEHPDPTQTMEPVTVVNEIDLPISSAPEVTLPSDWTAPPEPEPDDDNLAIDWAPTIKRFRESNGWSQRDLAQKLDVSNQAVSQWEQGMNAPRPSVQGVLSRLGLVDLVMKPGEPKPEQVITPLDAAKAFLNDPQMVKRGTSQDYVFLIDLLWAYHTLWAESHYMPAIDERTMSLAAGKRALRRGKPIDKRAGQQRTAYYGLKLVPAAPEQPPTEYTVPGRGGGTSADGKAAVEMFIEHRCEDAPGATSRVRDLHAAYDQWRGTIDGPALDIRNFAVALPKRYETVNVPDDDAPSGYVRGRAGLRLLPADQPKEADSPAGGVGEGDGGRSAAADGGAESEAAPAARPHLNDADTEAVRALMQPRKVVVIDGVEYPSEQAAIDAGVLVVPGSNGNGAQPVDTPTESVKPKRKAVRVAGDVPGRELTKEYRELVQELREHGWEYRRSPSGRGKPYVINPKGQRYRLPNTPSDVKGLMFTKTQLKNRLGADWLHASA